MTSVTLDARRIDCKHFGTCISYIIQLSSCSCLAFLADLVAAYILENLEDMFQSNDMTAPTYAKIYRDDGIKVDMGKKTTDEIVDWLEEFQQRSDELCGSNSLVFTMEIWNPESPPDEVPRNKKVTICKEESFPYLARIQKLHSKPSHMVFSVV